MLYNDRVYSMTNFRHQRKYVKNLHLLLHADYPHLTDEKRIELKQNDIRIAGERIIQRMKECNSNLVFNELMDDLRREIEPLDDKEAQNDFLQLAEYLRGECERMNPVS